MSAWRLVKPEIVSLDTRMRISNIGVLLGRYSLTTHQQVNKAIVQGLGKYTEGKARCYAIRGDGFTSEVKKL